MCKVVTICEKYNQFGCNSFANLLARNAVLQKNCTYLKLRGNQTLPWVPEPPVIEVKIRRGGSGHTSIQPHFGEFNI